MIRKYARLGGELSEHTRVIDEINAEIQAAKTPEQIQEEQEAKDRRLLRNKRRGCSCNT